jgi:hypothetical protein
VAIDPERHFDTITRRIAKGSLDHFVGARLRARRFSTLDYQPSVSLFFGRSRVDAVMADVGAA